jgi:MoxR-like ATPase
MSDLVFKGRGPIPGYTHPPDSPIDDPAGYRAGAGLVSAVQVALHLGRPLLVTGEPGTGKTQLAYRIAAENRLGEVLRFDTKSTSQAQDLFYTVDTVRQFATAQLDATAGRPITPVETFITWQALGTAILRSLPAAGGDPRLQAAAAPEPQRSVVLIDEVDKASRDFPNDLLNQIERFEFRLHELDLMLRADPRLRPVVVITSNSEKQLPDAFLRRCVFHHIEFPQDSDEVEAILAQRLARVPLQGRARQELLGLFLKLRSEPGFSRKPSTSELLDWLRALAFHGVDADRPLKGQAPVLRAAAGSLFKTSEDQAELQRLLNQSFN